MHTARSSKAILLAMTLGVTFATANAASAQQVTLVSSASDGTAGNSGAAEPSVSADGRFVAFSSSATNLVPGDTNGMTDAFVKDRLSGATTRVSVTSTGTQNTEHSGMVRISADGQFVVFSTMGALVPEDTSNCAIPPTPVAPCADVYIHDRQTGATTLVNVSSTGVQANKVNSPIDVSADGRFVLFSSQATNLVPNDTNDGDDLFLRDRQLGTTTRVSVDLAGNQFEGALSMPGRMSADGRVIIYTPGVPGGPQPNPIYLYDRETGLVSIVSNLFPGPSFPSSPAQLTPLAVSHDGRLVVVSQSAKELGDLGWPQIRFLFHDRLTGRTDSSPWSKVGTAAGPSFKGMSGDGRIYALGGLFWPLSLTDRVNGLSETIQPNILGFAGASLSTDGRILAFTNTQVYVYDRDSGDGDGMPSSWETTFGLNPTNLTDANADADLDGVTNLQEYQRGSHPAADALATRYFAEGAANAFFTTRLAAVNPGDEPAVAVFRFLGSNGQTSSKTFTIEPRSRITLELLEGQGPANDFATVIESNRLVVVDRTMTWDHTGYGAHTETAITSPSMTWYLAEGATHGAFSLFYLLQNANDARANVAVTYLRQAPLSPVTRTYEVEPNSRRTIPVDNEGPELEAVDTAASFLSDVPIVVERAMYSTRPGQPAFAAGHGAAGVTAPALRWFLAEGATGSFFDLYVLVGNPNTTQSDLKVTYLLPEGAPPFEKIYHVGPQQRLTIYPQDEDARLANTPVSVIVESTNNQPVVVERAMWWPKGEWHEAHVSAGATTTGTKWALADGEVTIGGDTYILIANTSTTAGTATVTLLEEGGTPVVINVDLQASSRFNVPVSAYLPPSDASPRRRFGALIESNGVEIVVERSIYTTVGGITWGAGTAALGTKLQ
jgi:Tol biopolymer transport system component